MVICILSALPIAKSTLIKWQSSFLHKACLYRLKSKRLNYKKYYNLSENSVWLDLQILYFRLCAIDKFYRQVLTLVNNSQLLLKPEILDKFRLVTFHKCTTQRNYNIITGSYQLRRNGSSRDLEPQSVNVMPLAA